MTKKLGAGEPFFCSWSGGKDSCLALYRAIKLGAKPKALLTMFIEGGARTRSHGLSDAVIAAQAKSLSIKSHKCSTSWDDYEANFKKMLDSLKKDGISSGVFGDIDLEPHLEWVERVCAEENMKAYLPLWKGKRRDLLNEFIDAGFKAMVICINKSKLEQKYLGRMVDHQLIDEFEKQGIDPCGEEGEYHTVVTDGPIFNFPIELNKKEISEHSGYYFLDCAMEHG